MLATFAERVLDAEINGHVIAAKCRVCGHAIGEDHLFLEATGRAEYAHRRCIKRADENLYRGEVMVAF